MVYTKGAAEIMLGLCDKSLQEDGSTRELAKSDRDHILSLFRNDGTRYLSALLQNNSLSSRASILQPHKKLTSVLCPSSEYPGVIK